MPEEQPPDRGTLAGHAIEVASILAEPRAFLLFLFAVLALFEWSSWQKTDRLVNVITEVLAGVETNRSREVSQQQQLVSDLIDILEYRDPTINPPRGGPRPEPAITPGKK